MAKTDDEWFHDRNGLFQEFITYLPGTLCAPDHWGFTILEARGFLLEKDVNNTYVLSGNAHPDDRIFLGNFLQQTRLGRLNQDIIELYENIQPFQFASLFSHHKNIDGGHFSHYDGWYSFKRRKHGRKIPVEYLDPYIARLVKSLSAIGILTDMSCDGYRKKPGDISKHPWIVFTDSINAVYFRVLFDTFIQKNTDITCEWTVSKKGAPDEVSSLVISSNDRLQIYREIQQVACLLYDNRQLLRQLKKSTIKDCKGTSHKKMETDEEFGFQTFSECASHFFSESIHEA